MSGFTDFTPDSAKTANIQLNYPVQLADRELAEVTIRRPTMGDLLDFEPKNATDVAGEMALIGLLCNLKKEEIRKLDSTDYTRLQEQYARFRVTPKH